MEIHAEGNEILLKMKKKVNAKVSKNEISRNFFIPEITTLKTLSVVCRGYKNTQSGFCPSSLQPLPK